MPVIILIALNQIVMKKIFFAVALLATVFVQQSFAQDSTRTQTSPLLTSYYVLKDALVSSNPNAAAASAGDFVKAVDAIDKEIKKMVTPESRSALVSDAAAISQSKDIKVQREKFASLSANVFTLAKMVKLSTEPVYQQYCPMKKASWLINNKAIKNPYYGSAMLTCGSVKETL